MITIAASLRLVLGLFIAGLFFFSLAPLSAVASDSIDNAEGSISDTAETLNERFQEARLTNKSFDQIVAWVIMGLLVGGIASAITPLKSSGWGWMGRLIIGLAGAYLGSVVAHVFQVSFNWVPVTIYMEELLFSFVFAIVLIGVFYFVSARMKKPKVPVGKH